MAKIYGLHSSDAVLLSQLLGRVSWPDTPQGVLSVITTEGLVEMRLTEPSMARSSATVLCPECKLPVPGEKYVEHYHDHVVMAGG